MWLYGSVRIDLLLYFLHPGHVMIRALMVTSRLKDLRLMRGLSQADLSKRSGISIGTISRYELDKVECFDRRVLGSLAKALDVDVGLLLVEKDG